MVFHQTRVIQIAFCLWGYYWFVCLFVWSFVHLFVHLFVCLFVSSHLCHIVDHQVKVLLTKAIEFLQSTGMVLRLPQLTIATAVVYFQRFYVVSCVCVCVFVCCVVFALFVLFACLYFISLFIGNTILISLFLVAQVYSLKKYDIFKLAAAALFLAGKVEETPKKLKEVIVVAWEGDPRRKQVRYRVIIVCCFSVLVFLF
jgi:hypothetical protein